MITGTVSGDQAPAIDTLPQGKGQLTFDDWQNTNAMKVDPVNLVLIPDPTQ